MMKRKLSYLLFPAGTARPQNVRTMRRWLNRLADMASGSELIQYRHRRRAKGYGWRKRTWVSTKDGATDENG